MRGVVWCLLQVGGGTAGWNWEVKFWESAYDSAVKNIDAAVRRGAVPVPKELPDRSRDAACGGSAVPTASLPLYSR